MSYFEERIFKEMKCAAEDIRCRYVYIDDDGYKKEFTQDIFTEDQMGNIRIRVCSIDRQPIRYNNPKLEERSTKATTDDTMVDYFVTRLSPENYAKKVADGKDVGKYNFPKGVGIFPFFPPALLDRYEQKERIPTLILTEGYFKAFVGSRCGLSIVGLPSITHYADTKSKHIHEDIAKLIRVCQVQTVIILHDGDCRNISLKALEKGEDLAKRPRGFFNAMDKTVEVLLECYVNTMYACVNTEELEPDKENVRPKGLDDLLLADKYEHKTKAIVDELTATNIKAGKYFLKMNTKGTRRRIYEKFFKLGSPNDFYAMHADEIGEKRFVFMGNKCHYDKEKELLIVDVPKELRDYIRVGCDFYRWIYKRNSKNDDKKRRELVPWRARTIDDDFGPGAHKQCKKYNAFIYMPEHIAYNEEVDNCLNKYYKLTHEPKAGKWPHIKWMMKHIFGDQYDLGMDYMTVMYRDPEHALPILCLISTERMTGKTSFLNLLGELFGENVIKIGNNEMQSDFNGFMAGKLVVAVDETSLADNAKTTERIKMLSTAKEQIINAKGKDQIVVKNYTKFVMCSNNETKFIYTDSNEIRFWVRKVPPIAKEEFLPDIMPFFEEEADAFLYELATRVMTVPQAIAREWFSADMIATDALVELNRAQRKQDEQKIYSWVLSYFYANRVDTVKVTVDLIKKSVDFGRDTPTPERISQIMKTTFGLKREATAMRVNVPTGFVGADGKPSYTSVVDKGWKITTDILFPEDKKALSEFLTTGRAE